MSTANLRYFRQACEQVEIDDVMEEIDRLSTSQGKSRVEIDATKSLAERDPVRQLDAGLRFDNDDEGIRIHHRQRDRAPSLAIADDEDRTRCLRTADAL